MSDHFIVGPAVDDAAKNMDLAEGAFVWFGPSANAAMPEAPKMAERWNLLQYGAVPYHSIRCHPHPITPTSTSIRPATAMYRHATLIAGAIWGD